MAVPDIEAKVYTAVKTKLLAEFPAVDISSLPEFKKPKTLSVRLYEFDNKTNGQYMTLTGGELFANVSYELQIRVTESNGKKQKAKAIFANINETMINLGFMRNSMSPFFEDTAYRIAARYSGKVDVNGNISRR